MMEDLFDGWLAMPFVADFLEKTRVEAAKLSQGSEVDHEANGKNGVQLHGPPSEHTAATGLASRHRRRHTKSRLGCIPCKKRKVKCSETWPSCTNCTKRGAHCRYPPFPKYTQRTPIVSEAPVPRPFIQLSDTPTTFSNDDMRMFHHYLISAHPSIPLAYEDIWVKDVPLYSHQYPYLMHAILGLAGSHNALQVSHSDRHATLLHRQKAIISLEQRFTHWPPKAEEAHVMLATSYLLCFQSSYISDGFMENILSLRGCALLSQLILADGLEGPFSVQADMHTAVMQSKFQSFPHLDQELATEALCSIKKFSHLLEAAQPIEQALVASLVGSVRPLLVSEEPPSPQTDAMHHAAPLNHGTPSHQPNTTPYGRLQDPSIPHPGDDTSSSHIDWSTITTPTSSTPDPLASFNALMFSLLILANYPHAQLLHLFDPSNKVGAVVLAHFLAVRVIVSPLSAPQTGLHVPVGAMVDWLTSMVDAVQGEYGGYVAWPAKILRCMQESVEKKKGLDFGDVLDMLKENPAVFK